MNVYLDETQLALLRSLGQTRGEPVAELIRRAVDEWLEREGVRAIPEDVWESRFDRLLERRGRAAATTKPDAEQVERDVAQAVSDARKARAARRS